jgi:hypothetical protein
VRTRILTPQEAHRARVEAADDLYFALDGLLIEFEKFSRYGSPIAHAANDRMTFARNALAKARGEQ